MSACWVSVHTAPVSSGASVTSGGMSADSVGVPVGSDSGCEASSVAAGTGDESSNRELSTDRANSVLDYLLTGKNGALTRYAQYFCAAGYGETRPVESNDTDAGRAANRRIEVSMILKDESVLKIVEEYLALELPEVGAQSTPAP